MLFRTVTTASTAVEHTFRDEEGEPILADTSVSVRVLRLDGTVLHGPTLADAPTPDDAYPYTVPARSIVDTLVLEWTGTSIGGAVRIERDYLEVVGAYMFGLHEVRSLEPALDPARFPAAVLKRVRAETEAEVERITGQSWVPKFGRVVRQGTGGRYMLLPDVNIRAVRSITIDGVALSGAELAAIEPLESGVLDRKYHLWPDSTRRCVYEYEHGKDFPPPDLHMAVMLRARSRLSLPSSGIPDRAISWSADDGGSYRLSMPTGEKTGVVTVDDAYERYTEDRGGFA